MRIAGINVTQTGDVGRTSAYLLMSPWNVRVSVEDTCGDLRTEMDVPIAHLNAAQWFANIPQYIPPGYTGSVTPVGWDVTPWTDDWKVTAHVSQPDFEHNPSYTVYAEDGGVRGTSANVPAHAYDVLGHDLCAAYGFTVWDGEPDMNQSDPDGDGIALEFSLGKFGKVSIPDVNFDWLDWRNVGSFDPRHGGALLDVVWGDLVYPEERERCPYLEPEEGWFAKNWRVVASGVVALVGVAAKEAPEDECEQMPPVVWDHLPTPSCVAGTARFSWVGPILTGTGYRYAAVPSEIVSGSFDTGAKWSSVPPLVASAGDWAVSSLSVEEYHALEESELRPFMGSWTCEGVEDMQVLSVSSPILGTFTVDTSEVPFVDIPHVYLTETRNRNGIRSIEVSIPGLSGSSSVHPLIDNRTHYLGYEVEWTGTHLKVRDEEGILLASLPAFRHQD
jgi:hypothetical protein